MLKANSSDEAAGGYGTETAEPKAELITEVAGRAEGSSVEGRAQSPSRFQATVSGARAWERLESHLTFGKKPLAPVPLHRDGSFPNSSTMGSLC